MCPFFSPTPRLIKTLPSRRGYGIKYLTVKMTIVAQKYFAQLLYPSWTVVKVGFTVVFKSANPTTFTLFVLNAAFIRGSYLLKRLAHVKTVYLSNKSRCINQETIYQTSLFYFQYHSGINANQVEFIPKRNPFQSNKTIVGDTRFSFDS